MKIKNLLTMLLTLALVAAACESNNGTKSPTTPDNTEEETPKDEGTEGDDEKQEDEDNGPEHPALPEATYALEENLDVRVHPLETNGLRNDYVSFFDVYSDVTLFIDFYAPLGSDYLPSGVYPLGDGSAMTSAYEYSYVTLETNGDLIRFTEGWAVVTAKHDAATGTTTHKVTAYYEMENGESVSVKYEGLFTIKNGI